MVKNCTNAKIFVVKICISIEIDFFIRYNNRVIEVKSADNTKAKSMKSLIENWHVEHGIKFSSKNVGISKNVDSYPLYMAMFL